LDIKQVQKVNRETLKTIESFVNDEDYYGSPDNYGLPNHVYHLIDLPVNEEITYVDLLMFLQTYFKKDKIRYVEIGVSVLKTFYQVSQFLSNSDLYAFDINKPNPKIASKFEIVSDDGQLRRYKTKTNNVSYFQGDVFKREDFEKFRDHVDSKVNIVFSDAHHTGLGLASEYGNFIQDFLDDDFILYYDDLGNEAMRHVFLDIATDIHRKRPNTTSAFIEVNGWLGQHEHRHLNGIITSLNIGQILSDNNLSIPRQILR
jgi:hypothetical protein